MLKAYIFLVLWLIVACNCRSLETRARISTNNEDEHVHIKVLLPKVLRKHKLPRHTTRPQYAKHLPTHYETLSRPKLPQQGPASITETIFSQHYDDDDFELPAPMPMLTTEHEILAHIAATAPLADDDISHNQGIRTQRQKQQQKRTPTMMPPPSPIPLSSPMMAQHLYDGKNSDIFSSTLLDGNILTADDFLREMQQLYAQKYGTKMTTTLMMQPQMQALTKATTSTPTTILRKNPKKRKHSKNDSNNSNSNNYNNKFHFSKPANSQEYYAKMQQQQQQQQQHQLEQLNLHVKPYSSNQAYSNYYHYYDDYNNKNFFDNKKTKFNIIDHTPMGVKELNTEDTSDDIDANNSSSEDYTADGVSDTVMAFSAPIHPEEPYSFLASSTPYSIANNMQTNNNNNYNTYGGDGFDDDNNNENDGFNPISYQDLYATYSATPATHHLATMPTRLKFKRQEQAIQQQQGKPFREQFAQLSSIAPVVSTGINALRSTQRAPTTTTTSTMGEISNIYGAAQQPLERYRKQQSRSKMKRNRLMVQ